MLYLRESGKAFAARRTAEMRLRRMPWVTLFYDSPDTSLQSTWTARSGKVPSEAAQWSDITGLRLSIANIVVRLQRPEALLGVLGNRQSVNESGQSGLGNCLPA